MPTSPWSNVVVSTVIFACGTVSITYQELAAKSGLTVGALFHGPRPVILLIGIANTVAAVAATYLVAPWWSIIIVIPGGFLAAHALVGTLRTWSQPTSVVVPPLLWLVWFSESIRWQVASFLLACAVVPLVASGGTNLGLMVAIGPLGLIKAVSRFWAKAIYVFVGFVVAAAASFIAIYSSQALASVAQLHASVAMVAIPAVFHLVGQLSKIDAIRRDVSNVRAILDVHGQAQSYDRSHDLWTATGHLVGWLVGYVSGVIKFLGSNALL